MQQTNPKQPAEFKSNKGHILTSILKRKRVDRDRKSIALMHLKTA